MHGTAPVDAIDAFAKAWP